MKVYPHTIFFTIGPSSSGKTYFCKNILIPFLKSIQAKQITYISSDDIRRELLDSPAEDKLSVSMLSVSSLAFDMLFTKVNLFSSFPVNSEFIIVDTKGTNEHFRDKIYAIAKKNNYQVVPVIFNFKHFDDYHKFAPMADFIKRDVDKTRKSLQGLRKQPQVIDILTIKSPDDSVLLEPSEEHFEYLKCFVPDSDYLIFSDIHGNYNEFVKLLHLNDVDLVDGKLPDSFNKCLIINGDFIDTGTQPFQMIDFIINNRDKILVVTGNHEHRLYKELQGELIHQDKAWYNTYDIIKNNQEYIDKFFQIYESSLPFLKNSNFIITHAPCSVKYLMKTDAKSKARQRYFQKDESVLNLFDELSGSLDMFSTDLIHLKYFFGHCPVLTPGVSIKGRIPIDGGANVSGYMVSADVNKAGKCFYQRIHTNTPSGYRISTWKSPAVHIEDAFNTLNDHDKQRVEDMILSKVNFLSGTMAPAPQSSDNLESLESAVNLFKSHDITNITVQRKYMGSRATLYLFPSNLDNSYIISRKGRKFMIKSLFSENIQVFTTLLNNLNKITYHENKVKLYIIDGELLPWSLLSESLIKRFYYVGDSVKQEFEYLQKADFRKNFDTLYKRMHDSDFIKDKTRLSKVELMNKYGYRDYESFSSILQVQFDSGDSERDNLSRYLEQLSIYGNDSLKSDFKAFSLLKIVFEDDSEILGDFIIPSNFEQFNLLNTDSSIQVDLLDENAVSQIESFYHDLIKNEHIEGIVLKPDLISFSEKIPYIKVRNPDYLSLVYGYNYQFLPKYSSLLKKKSISAKLKASRKEYLLGHKLLEIPYSELFLNNQELKNILAEFLKEIDNEVLFDPRL